MIQAIFFDFNGVIIDDEPLQMAAYQGVLREQGLSLLRATTTARSGWTTRRLCELRLNVRSKR